MTIQELTTLADIMRGREVNSTTLARKVLELHADLEGMRARPNKGVQPLRGKTKRNLEVKIARLEKALADKQHALDFAVRRNEVLRRQG